MKDLLSKQDTNLLIAKEEKFLNWGEILEKLKRNFGTDIYESWMKNLS